MLLKAISKDYLRSLVVSLIAVVIVVPLFCVCIIIPLGLVNQPNTSIWVLIVPAVGFLATLLGGGLGFFALSLYRRKHWLDGIFTPLGLQGSLYMLTGRQYRGAIQGREVSIRFYRGPTLDLYISAPLQTRLSITHKDMASPALARMFGHQAMSPDIPGVNDLNIFAMDENWARSLLAGAEAQSIIRRLLDAGASWALLRQIHFQPEALYLRLYRNKNLFKYDITPEEGRQWLNDLLALARVAESLPAPQTTAEESSLEQMARTGSMAKTSTYVIIAVIIGTLVGIPLCGVAITALILLLDK